MPDAINAVQLDNIAHVIQVALTPVFLLSGIAALLNVFNTRLARVSDHVSHTADLLAADPQGEDAGLMRSHIRRLRRRVLALDAAILLAALGGATAACVPRLRKTWSPAKTRIPPSFSRTSSVFDATNRPLPMMRDPGAPNLVLARQASDVGTGTADPPTLDDGGPPPRLREMPSQ
jgi:hypothetical protein